jgi:uncharacterized protein YjbJ (UPF0337 family)
VCCRTDHTFTSADPESALALDVPAECVQGDGMNKDQVKGRVEQVKGKVKQVAGALVGNKSLEQQGKVQKAVGKVEAGIGDLKEDLKKGS